MKSMERRLMALEKQHPATPDLSTIIEITDHKGNPGFAWVWTGADWQTVTRLNGEVTEAYRARVEALESPQGVPETRVEDHVAMLMSLVNGRTRTK